MATTNGKGTRGLGLRPPAAEPQRRIGRVAEEAQLRARVEIARVLGDKNDERVATRKLAETLAARDVELDTAVELAFKTLSAHDDPELRLLLAGWLELLGEPALAASELNKVLAQREGDPSAAALLVRVGVLHARAGDAVGAQEALAEAAQLDQADALPLELLGAVAAWAKATNRVAAGEGIKPREGAEAYVRAARRRVAAGDPDAEIEDMLRAFELDPSSALAAAALMGAYSVRGNAQAADEVLRAHAEALAHARAEPEAAAAVHTKRRESAIEAGDLSRAFSAALDERLDGAFDGPNGDAFDDLLARTSAFEPLAVRLEVRAERERGRAAAQRWADLGRLLSGPLAASERAVEAYARSIAADATSTDNLHALKSLAEKVGDETWLVEGLVRAVLGVHAYGASEDVASRLAAARALALHAEAKHDVLLATWAHAQTVNLDSSDERARAAVARGEEAVRRRDEELALARQSLENSAESGRVPALQEIASLLRTAPDASREWANTLVELALATIDDDDDDIIREAIQAAERVSDFESIVKLVRARLERRSANVRLRGLLVTALRRKGDAEAAVEATRAFAEDAATRWTCSVAWITSALAGDRATRGLALMASAPTCAGGVVATVAATGAEELARVGDVTAARRAAEQALRHDPRNVRALRVLAELASPAEGRIAAAAIERAIEVAGPSAALCARLADALEHVGDFPAAIAWARRNVALRPGDPAAVQALLDRAIRVDHADALADVLGWLVPQPQPAKETAERIAPAITALAKRDAKRAAFIARRALDLLGPRHPALLAAVESSADAAGDSALRARATERWIAAGAPAAERGPLLMELAAYYAKNEDVERELRTYVRAIREGVELMPLAERIVALKDVPKSDDADLAWLEVRAELFIHEGRMDEATDAFRQLGASLWDMADDRPRAVSAWLRAAHCDSAHGYATLRRDLASFADPQYAVDCLVELVERESDRIRSGVIATQAAHAALDVGAYSRALALAKTALDRDPGHAEALVTAEAACKFVARIPDMSAIYDQVARRSLGRFGRRAAHHRAARFFESSNIPMLALKHAAQAFIAVPSEGSTLGLLQRTAEKAQRQSIAVRTVEHVAELSRSSHTRAAWLLRAATMTSKDLDGARQKNDLLLKAAVLVPAPVTLGMLSAAAREVIALAPDDAEAVRMRLERASDSLAKQLEGPDGARMGIIFTEMALELFDDGGWGWRGLHNAISADADIDEYVRLLPHAQTLAKFEAAADRLEELFQEIEKPYSNVGHALLRLAGAIAQGLGDAEKRARALVRAAEKESDDDEIVVEADAALVAHDDPELVKRFERRVNALRRTEALRGVAKKHPDRAIALLERAHFLAPAEVKGEVATELSEALTGAGRGEEAIKRDLERPDLENAARASKLVELARIRRENKDESGAVDALLEAAEAEPSLERWNAVEAAANKAARADVRARALAEIVKLVTGSDRLDAMKRLARAEAARGSLGAAESAWREVWKALPADSEADVAIEALLVAKNAHEDLATHLAARAQRLVGDSTQLETLRAVRLRRAAILEQRLGRFEDAIAELEQVLRETPNHPSALRWLADLYERSGQPSKALPALDKLFGAATDEVEFVNIGVRRARAFLAAGDLAKAQESVRELREKAPYAIAVAEARVEVARASQDPAELGDALADLARVSVEEPRVRSEMLVEAAQAAARAGNAEMSLARARDAARLAPDIASTQLFARGLEYRLRGAGNKDQAAETIAQLSNVVEQGLEPEDIALRAFLLAEAEDIVHGPGGGEKTLVACTKRIGSQPLVALGLAERAVKAGRHADAYRFYVEAVYGNLLGLRRPGRVALAGADSAEAAGDTDTLVRFLNEAGKDPETRAGALKRLAKVALAQNDVNRARNVLRGLADMSRGKDKAEALALLARALMASENASHRVEADRTMREAIENASPEAVAVLKEELASFRERVPAPKPPPLPPKRTSAEPAPAPMPAPVPVPVPIPVQTGNTLPGAGKPIIIPPSIVPEVPPPVTMHVADEALMSVRHPPLDAPPLDAPAVAPVVASVVAPAPPASASSLLAKEPTHRVAEAMRLVEAGERERGETILGEALRAGSIEAADALDELIAPDPARRAALIKVRRQAAELLPGDVKRLTALRDAAKQDQNLNYARAIDHVLRAFDAADGPLPPPPLSAQSEQPGLFLLLTKHSREPAGEAYAATWEGAQSLFAKPPAAYGMSGLERVVPGPASALARVYEAAVRLLDTPRFALFHRRDKGALSLTIALLAAPSAIIIGDVKEDSKELRWLLGQALSAVLPQNALVIGMPEEDSRALWEALLVAFGPTAPLHMAKSHARLAETLWQTMAPRSQRRLKDLLAEAKGTNWESAIERARESGRRVGMFLTGDFGHAARTVVTEAKADPAELAAPGGLARLCAKLPSLADLYRLAIRPEYADARWHVPPAAAKRLSTGRVPVV